MFFHAFYYISGPIGSLFNDHEVPVNAVREEAAAQDELSVGGRKREQPRRLESD